MPPWERYQGAPQEQGPWARYGEMPPAAPPAAATGSWLDNVVRQVASGASLGFADEIAALGDAAVQPILGKIGGNISQAGDFSQRYRENIERERAQDRAFEASNPVTAGAGKVGGAIAGSVAMLPAAAFSGGATMLGQMGRAGLAGGILGGAGGFGEGEGGLAPRLASAGMGAGIGAGVGAASVPVVRGIQATGRWLGETIPGMWATRVAGGQDTAPSAAAERIARALSRDKMTPAELAANMANLGPEATAADAGGKMLQRLAQTVSISPGEGPQIADTMINARNRATGTRIMADVGKSISDDASYFAKSGALAASKSAEADKLFTAAREAGLNVSDDMRDMMRIPAIKEAIDSIGDDAVRLGQQLTPVEVAHRVKQKMADVAQAAFASGKPINKTDLASLADKWRTALHEANPAIKAADAAYSAASNTQEALDLGRMFMRTGTSEIAGKVAPEALAAKFAVMTDAEKEAFRVGVASTIRESAMSGTDAARRLAKNIDQNDLLRSKIAEIVGDEGASRIFKMAAREQTFAKADRFIRGGSDTAAKLAEMADQGMQSIPTSPGTMTNKALAAALQFYQRQRAGNEPIRNEIARQLFDPRLNALMLERLNASLQAPSAPPLALTAGIGSAAAQTRRQ